MSKFKVGDHVRVILAGSKHFDAVGVVVTVFLSDHDLPEAYRVRVAPARHRIYGPSDLTLADPDVHTVLDQMDAESGFAQADLTPHLDQFERNKKAIRNEMKTDLRGNQRSSKDMAEQEIDGDYVRGGEVRSVSSTGAEKGTKVERFDLLPADALAKVAHHYAVGAEKYADHNWRKGYEWSKSYAALQRHANLFWAGQDNDEETGTPHMAAVAFHALSLLTFMDEQPGFDDRYRAEAAQ